MTLIKKKDRNTRYLSNWRPFSLIDADVKMGSKTIAKTSEKSILYLSILTITAHTLKVERFLMLLEP